MVFKISSQTHTQLVAYANHPWALGILAFISFGASICFPFPPDPLLGLMALETPLRIPFFVGVASLSASLGGLCMYGIGYGFFETIGVWLVDLYGWQDQIIHFQSQLNAFGLWGLILKAFVPVPYKLIALTYGMGHFDPVLFFLGSLLGRLTRYGLEGFFLWKFGPIVRPLVERFLPILCVLFVAVVLIGFFLVIWL